MTTTPRWTAVRDELRERREARLRERALRAELAAYSTPEEVGDLFAALRRVDSTDPAAADAALIESILQDNLREHWEKRGPGSHVAGL